MLHTHTHSLTQKVPLRQDRKHPWVLWQPKEHHGSGMPQAKTTTGVGGCVCVCFLPNHFFTPSLTLSFSSSLFLYLQSVSFLLCNHILYTIGSQSNLMHRYSLIKLICSDSLLQSVLNSFMPPYQNTHTHTYAEHPHSTMFLLAALQPIQMPHSSQNVTPNYFLISLKQLFPIQHNRSLIGDAKQQRLDNEQTPGMSWNDTLGWVEEWICRQAVVHTEHLSAETEPRLMGLSLQSSGVFENVAVANHTKQKTLSFYSSSCTSESNLLHKDNRKLQRELFLSLEFPSVFTCLSPSSFSPALVLRDSISPPASKLHCNYTSCFIELDGDYSLYAYRDRPPL